MFLINFCIFRIRFLMPGYLSTRAAFQARFMRYVQACRNPRATEQQCKVRARGGNCAFKILFKFSGW